MPRGNLTTEELAGWLAEIDEQDECVYPEDTDDVRALIVELLAWRRGEKRIDAN